MEINRMNMPRFLKFPTLALVSALTLAGLSGCSSVISDSEYRVRVSSAPSDAWFEVKNRSGRTVYSGQTPDRVTLQAGAGLFLGERYTFTFSKPGFEEQTIVLESSLDGWWFGNAVLTQVGLVGALIIDPATGAMWKLPYSINSSLRESNDRNALEIRDINELTPDEREALTPL